MVARADQLLIAVPIERNGEEHIHHFVDDIEADTALADAGTRRPIKLAGIWSDLDEDEVLASLDRIRHESTPTSPLDDV
ncbi:MAG: hypothetical protein IT340_07970 [Chloroflexi bacterium]|nr:hypothetical protein [Chloroflexota bacterium]